MPAPVEPAQAVHPLSNGTKNGTEVNGITKKEEDYSVSFVRVNNAGLEF